MLMVKNFATLMPAPLRRGEGAFNLFALAYRVLLFNLTKILIVTLFLLSAITFSTETIPNFQPDCEVSSARKAAMLRTIKIVLPRTLLQLPQERVPPRILFFSPPPPPLSGKIARFITPSRAPPSPVI